jgi:BMFP domain-containing protein YqiC
MEGVGGRIKEGYHDLESKVFDTKQLDELTQRVMKVLPPGVQAMQQDVEKNIRAAMQSVFAKLDLVTREEFEVQSAVLQRTREKLATLQARITELEKQTGQAG